MQRSVDIMKFLADSSKGTLTCMVTPTLLASLIPRESERSDIIYDIRSLYTIKLMVVCAKKREQKARGDIICMSGT